MSELGPCVSIHDLDADASRGLISHSRSAAVSRRLAPTKAPKNSHRQPARSPCTRGVTQAQVVLARLLASPGSFPIPGTNLHRLHKKCRQRI
jgi:hypothetical protein